MSKEDIIERMLFELKAAGIRAAAIPIKKVILQKLLSEKEWNKANNENGPQLQQRLSAIYNELKALREQIKKKGEAKTKPQLIKDLLVLFEKNRDKKK